jgi:hypothetical protein
MLESHGTRGTENAVMTGKHTLKQTYVRSYTLRGWIGLKIGASARWILLVRSSAIFSLRARQPDASSTRNRVARARVCREARNRVKIASDRNQRRSTF